MTPWVVGTVALDVRQFLFWLGAGAHEAPHGPYRGGRDDDGHPSREENPPDPNGPPVLPYCSLKKTRKILEVSGTTAVVVAIGGVVALIALGTVTTSTSGALRSQRVKGEERKAEIAQAQAQSDAAPESPAPEHPHD